MSIRSNCVMAMLFSIVVAAGTSAADLQQQIDDAIAAGQRELIIAPGVYRLPAKPGQPQLLIKGAKDLTINAGGVTIVSTSLDQALKLQDCQRVEINGLVIDYDPVPFTQGVVIAKAEDDTWMDVKIDAGYPAAAPDKGRRVILYDPQTRLVKAGTWTRHSVTVTPKEDGVARISWAHPVKDTAAVGDPVTLTRKTNTPHGFFVERSTDCTFRDITLHASTSFGFFETHGGGNKYLACIVTPGPTPAGATAPRLLSSQADSFHSKHATRGPTIENCRFDSMGDDGIAINGSFALVVAGSGDTAIISPQRDLPFQAGDRLHGVSRAGQPTKDVKILSITAVPPEEARDAKAIQLKHYPDLRLADTFFKQTYQLTLSEPLPLTEGDLVASPDRNGSHFTVRNNTLRNTRARGILIKASYGLIENNTIDHTFLAGIVLCPETRYWHEADYSTDVLIRGNTLRDTGRGAGNAGMIQAGAITVCAEGDGRKLSPAGGHRKITIENNRLERANGANIMITSASDVTIRNNALIDPRPTPTTHGALYGVDATADIWITESTDVTLENNTTNSAAANIVTTDSATNIKK